VCVSEINFSISLRELPDYLSIYFRYTYIGGICKYALFLHDKVSTIEELLERKKEGAPLQKSEITAVGDQPR
jgi:hypothetical protein